MEAVLASSSGIGDGSTVWTGRTSMRAAVAVALAAAGGVLATAAYRVQVHDLHSPVDHAVATVVVGLAFLAAGLVAWLRRPANHVGPLLAAAGVALLARQLRYSSEAALFTVF